VAFTEFYVRTGGSNLNAGSTNADAAALTLTGGDWVQATRVFTKTGAVTGVSVGMWASVYADGAAAPTGFVGRITAFDANTITIDATAIAGTAPTNGTANRTIKVGGAWGGSGNNDVSHSFTFPTGSLVNSGGDATRVNLIGTYNVTSGINVSATGPVYHMGCTATAGDGGMAVIAGGTSNINQLTITTSDHLLAYIEWSSTATTGTGTLVTINSGIRAVFYRCRCRGARNYGFSGNTAVAIECEAIDCNKANSVDVSGFFVILCIRCIAHDFTTATTQGNGFGAVTDAYWVDCVADRCNGAGFLASRVSVLTGCSAYNCIDAVKTSNVTLPVLVVDNSNMVVSSGYGVNAYHSAGIYVGIASGFYSNTSGNHSTTAAAMVWEPTASTSLAGNPYTSVSTGGRPTVGDFTIVSTTGYGRAAGSGYYLQDSGYYSSTTTSYPDRGAVQHQDAGGGGTTVIISGEF
jgi:hypothetical protein